MPFGYRKELNVDANLELTTGPWCYRLLVQLRTLPRGSNLFLNSVVQLMLPWVKLTKVSVLLFKSVSELQKAKSEKTKDEKSVYDTKGLVCILGDNLKASKDKPVFNWFCFHLLRMVLFHILWGWGGKRAYFLLLLSLGTRLVTCVSVFNWFCFISLGRWWSTLPSTYFSHTMKVCISCSVVFLFIIIVSTCYIFLPNWSR